MAMRTTLGQLRKLIIQEMKLGIAGGQGNERAWGKKPLPDPEPYFPPEGGETYIATDIKDWDPGEKVKSQYRSRDSYDWAGDPIDDDLDDLGGGYVDPMAPTELDMRKKL